MQTQFGRKPPLPSSMSSIFIIKKTSYSQVLVKTHTSTHAPTCIRLQPSLVLQLLLEGSFNPLISFTSHSWKGSTTPWSHLPTTLGRELLPPDLIYQLPLEGSYYPLTEVFNPQHHHGPCFINFHTGSNNFHITQLVGSFHHIFRLESLHTFKLKENTSNWNL